MIICGFILIIWKVWLAIDRTAESIKTSSFLLWLQVLPRGVFSELVEVVPLPLSFPPRPRVFLTNAVMQVSASPVIRAPIPIAFFLSSETRLVVWAKHILSNSLHYLFPHFANKCSFQGVRRCPWAGPQR